MCWVFLLWSAKLTSNAASVETKSAELTEADYFADIPVALSATRLQQPIDETPVAMSIIDREMIEASGFTEIPDLLRLVPGFHVSYDSGHIVAAGYHIARITHYFLISIFQPNQFVTITSWIT